MNNALQHLLKTNIPVGIVVAIPASHGGEGFNSPRGGKHFLKIVINISNEDHKKFNR